MLACYNRGRLLLYYIRRWNFLTKIHVFIWLRIVPKLQSDAIWKYIRSNLYYWITLSVKNNINSYCTITWDNGNLQCRRKLSCVACLFFVKQKRVSPLKVTCGILGQYSCKSILFLAICMYRKNVLKNRGDNNLHDKAIPSLLWTSFNQKINDFYYRQKLSFCLFYYFRE